MFLVLVIHKYNDHFIQNPLHHLHIFPFCLFTVLRAVGYTPFSYYMALSEIYIHENIFKPLFVY